MDIQSIRFVTARYGRMQGLRLLPLGILFLAASLWRAGWLWWLPGSDGAGAVVWFWTGLAIAVGLSFVMRAFYLRRFGRTEVSLWRGGGPSFIGLCVVFLATVWLQEVSASLVSLPAVFVSMALGYVGTAHRSRTHYLPVAAFCLVFAMLGIVGVSSALRDMLLDAVIGVVLVVAGIGDHVVLTRALRPPLSRHDASTV